MKYRLLIILLSLLASMSLEAGVSNLFDHPVDAADKRLIQVLRRSAVEGEHRRNFVQEKHMANRALPLRSSGKMVVGNTSMCMQTREPVAMAMKISPEGIWQRIGADTSFTPAKKNGRSRFTVQMMTTLFSADANAYSQLFELYLLGDGKEWQLGLKPKSKRVSRFIEKIVLTGSDDLEQITVYLKGGDVNDIYLETETEPSTVTLSNCVS